MSVYIRNMYVGSNCSPCCFLESLLFTCSSCSECLEMGLEVHEVSCQTCSTCSSNTAEFGPRPFGAVMKGLHLMNCKFTMACLSVLLTKPGQGWLSPLKVCNSIPSHKPKSQWSTQPHGESCQAGLLLAKERGMSSLLQQHEPEQVVQQAGALAAGKGIQAPPGGCCTPAM